MNQSWDIDGDFMALLGDTVGSFATQHSNSQSEFERICSGDALAKELERTLCELEKRSVLAPEICKTLYERAMSNAPTQVEYGWVHSQLRPENILKTTGGLVLRNSETLSIGALDGALASIWGVWKLTPHERSRFLEGYRSHRCTKSFVLHELFWSIFALMSTLKDRVTKDIFHQDLVQASTEIARGELPFSWFESKAVKVKRLGVEKIRVAFLMDYLAIGGQERVCFEMLRAFDRSIFQPYLYAFRGGTMARAFQSLGIPVMIGSDRDPLASLEWTDQDRAEKRDYDRRLANTLRDDRIDAALVFSWKSAPMVLQAAGVKVAIDKLDGPSLLGKVKDKSGFDWIVPQSETLRLDMKARQDEYSFSETKLATIYSGIDLSTFNPKEWQKSEQRGQLGLRDDQLVIGFVGRLIQGKDVGFLVQAFASFLERVPEIADRCVLLICGPDGGALAGIQEDVQRLELEQHFLYLPPPASVAQVMSVFDVFVMSSKSEGLPSVILEAMAMGLPIVSTATGSIPEVISGNGYVSEMGDLEPFVRNLVQLANEPQMRKCMGEASRRISGRFASRHAVGRYEELLIDALLAKLANPKKT